MFRRLIIMFFVLAGGLAAVQPVRAESPATLGRGQLRALAISPDGTRLATATTLGVFLFDAQTLAPTGQWNVPFMIDSLVWSPNGSAVLLTSFRQIQVRAAADGAVLWSGPGCASCEWGFSRDGAAVAQVRDFTHVTLLNALTGAAEPERDLGRFFPALTWQLEHLTLPGRQSPTGWRLAAGAAYSTTGADTYVYDVAHQSALAHASAYGSALSSDGRWLAVGRNVGPVQIYQVVDGEPLFTLKEPMPDAPWHSLAWAPDNRTLYDGTTAQVIVWDTQTGQVLRTLAGFTLGVGQVAWSADGSRLIATQGSELNAWEVATRRIAASGAMSEFALDYWSTTEMVASPAGDRVAVADWSGVTIHAADSLQPLHRLMIGRPVMALAFSPDGALLATAGDGPFINLWETATGRPVQDLRGNILNNSISALAFTPDGRHLYALEGTGELRLWDLARGTATAVQTHMPPGAANYYGYYDPAIHPGVHRVAAEHGRFGLDVSDTETGQLQYTLPVPYSTSIQINATGTRLAALAHGHVQIWDLQSGAQLADLQPPVESWIGGFSDLAFSPDGSRLAAGNRSGFIMIWSTP